MNLTDWDMLMLQRYSNHAFIVLTLQKLVHVVDEDASDDEDDDRSYISKKSTRSIKGLRTLWRRLFGGAKEPPSQGQARDAEAERGKAYGGGRAKVTNLMGNGSGNHIYQHAGANNYRGKVTSQPTGFSEAPSVTNLRTLHRYHATSNELRADFMEKHSALASRQMAVTAEQVSIFVTSDNTIISFFELSALDVQRPILTRLNTAGTILRQSCDAFMVAQAIIDAITDLAIPVTALYGEVIGDLEVDVLTRPTIEHTKSLYIIICEINKLLSFIKPVVNLVTALRDHKTDGGPEAAAGQLQDPTRGVVVTPVTYTYLGDVLDHLLLIADSLEQIRGTADGLIGLIFNTISNDQNRNMQQLTVTTIFFLPMTFITGYFGQNFDNFTELTYGTSYL